MRRWLPVAEWLPTYRPRWLLPDTVAGLTVWALVVPESMAYASIAGVPVQYGLYSVPLAVLGYLLFGSSRRLFVGPSSTVAALSATTVAPLAAAGGADYIALTAALSLLVGALYLLFGMLRMGFISRFFARPVLDGFVIGLGIYIAVGQLHKVVGLPSTSGDTLRQLWAVVSSVGDWNAATAVVGVTSLVLLFALSRVAPKVPGALVVVVGGLVATGAFGLAARGVSLVGTVPTGFDFVPWSTVTVDALWSMVPGAIAIVVVGFAQSLAIAKAYAAEDRQPVDANQELIGYGAANLGSGVLQGFPLTGSLSKSAAATEAGGRSPVSFLVTGVFTLLTVLFLAGLFEKLPEAVLGAVVIHAVAGMIQPSKISRLRRASVPDFWLALAAMLGVVVIGIVAGIVIGVVLSLVMLVHRVDHPRSAELGVTSDGGRFTELGRGDARRVPGVLIHRLEAPLIFPNAEVAMADLRARLAACQPQPRLVVLDLEAVYEVDMQALDELNLVVEDLEAAGIGLALARAHPSVASYIERAAERPLRDVPVHATVATAVRGGPVADDPA